MIAVNLTTNLNQRSAQYQIRSHSTTIKSLESLHWKFLLRSSLLWGRALKVSGREEGGGGGGKRNLKFQGGIEIESFRGMGGN